MTEILNLDYNERVQLVGTAHFTRRSMNDAYEAIKSSRPKDVALELDMRRYLNLNAHCVGCPRALSCKGLCEFTGATDALGNVNANIWLIDMTEEELRQRIRRGVGTFERPRIRVAMGQSGEDPVRLWELGYKNEVVDYSERQMEAMRRVSPSVPRVLIDERNALMAARLAWVASKDPVTENSKILAFVGAVHVKGIRELLRNPVLIQDRLRRFSLSFSEPTLIRRVAVEAV